MQQTASEIRAHLKKLGYPSRSVSVRCKPSYTIQVTSELSGIDITKLRADVIEVYHKHSHSWLIVSVNNYYLPMPPVPKVACND